MNTMQRLQARTTANLRRHAADMRADQKSAELREANARLQDRVNELEAEVASLLQDEDEDFWRHNEDDE